MIEKCGKPHSKTSPKGSGMFWSFGPDGERCRNIICSGAMGGNFVTVNNFTFSQGAAWSPSCGIGLEVNIIGRLASRILQSLVDGQLEYKNLMNIKKALDDVAAKRLQEQKANAEKQKSPSKSAAGDRSQKRDGGRAMLCAVLHWRLTHA
jgi:hypothetical protein